MLSVDDELLDGEDLRGMHVEEPDGWRALASQREIQRDAFGIDLDGMSPVELAEYMVHNAWALTAELGEAMREVAWKRWGRAPRGFLNRAACLEELVDAWLFLANMLNAIEVDDDEWVDAIQSKQRENERRQAAEYAGWEERI